MCSLTESELEPELIKVKLDPNSQKICKKCKEKPPCVNLRANDTYCKECFLTSVHHKFRATLGKHKAMRPGEKVCVAYSGGGASTSLLHLLKVGIESDHKKLLFHPEILHIDEGAIFNLDDNQTSINIRKKLDYVSKFGFKVYVILLEDPSRIAEYSSEVELDQLFQNGKRQEVYTCLQNIKEPSAREEFIQNLRRHAIIQGAELMQCKKVFTGENATKISIDLLTGVSLGKGGNLAQETGFRDTRHSDIMMLRPLRDVSGKELALYAQYHCLSIFSEPTITTGKESLFSIRKLTEDFLIGLHNDFPATLSTVFKTGDKLQVEMNEDGKGDDNTCVFCDALLDTDTEHHNSLQATNWSSIVSSKGKSLEGDTLVSDNLFNLDLSSLLLDSDNPSSCPPADSQECCGQGDGSCKSSSKKTITKSQLMPLVCYSCTRVVANIKDVNLVPSLIRQRIERSSNRKVMRNEIQDFLL